MGGALPSTSAANVGKARTPAKASGGNVLLNKDDDDDDKKKFRAVRTLTFADKGASIGQEVVDLV